MYRDLSNRVLVCTVWYRHGIRWSPHRFLSGPRRGHVTVRVGRGRESLLRACAWAILARRAGSRARWGGMGGAPVEHVFVDGNNVMGARPDGWWRDRRGAARRLVREIATVARACGGVWTVVFDGRAPARVFRRSGPSTRPARPADGPFDLTAGGIRRSVLPPRVHQAGLLRRGLDGPGAVTSDACGYALPTSLCEKRQVGVTLPAGSHPRL